MHRFYFTVFIILALAIIVVNPYPSFAYEKELKSISTNMSEKIAKAGKKTVAVVDFTDLQGNVTELGRFIAEEFSVALADADKGFEVVDRTHLQTLLKEHKLSITGIIDPSTAKKLGEIAGVDALVTGTITPFGDSVRISIKILDTSTAKVIGASSGEIAKTKAIEELLARGISRAIPGEQGVTNSSSALQPQKEKVGEKSKDTDYVWEDGILRVTVESLKKTGKTVTLNILYENISDKPIKISFIPTNYFGEALGAAHLLDEDGGRWIYKNGSDTAQVDSSYGRDLLPLKKIRSKMVYEAKDSDIGSIFDLFMKGGGGADFHQYTLTIQNIRGD